LKDKFDSYNRSPWHLNETLLHNQTFVQHIENTLTNYFWENTSPEIHVETTWLAHKPVIRGELLKRAHFLKHTSHAQQVTWYKQLHDLNKLNQTHPSPELKQQISDVQHKIQCLALTKVGYSLRKLKATQYSQGNRASKILAQRLRDRRAAFKRAYLQTSQG
ncbi:Hypothetical predicted protein, partial [Pelobates cultripes]